MQKPEKTFSMKMSPMILDEKNPPAKEKEKNFMTKAAALVGNEVHHFGPQCRISFELVISVHQRCTIRNNGTKR